jgi:hypothetical protein
MDVTRVKAVLREKIAICFQVSRKVDALPEDRLMYSDEIVMRHKVLFVVGGDGLIRVL